MSIKLLLSIFILLASLLTTYKQLPLEPVQIPDRHKQMILVSSESWDAQTGILQRYDKKEEKWVKVGKSLEVSLGKNGMGWGRGLHNLVEDDPQKVEGDGKSPAGIFKFGVAFGYDNIAPVGSKILYRPATSRDYWVDAVNSPDYNTWVTIAEDKLNDPKSMWHSFERMKRVDHLYELGLVVEHNMAPVEKGKGSAIFMHVWRRPGAPTSGCTAMNKQDLTELGTWLDPEKEPLLVQVPKGEFNKLKFRGN